MTNDQFVELKRGQVVRFNKYNILGMVISSFVNRNAIHEVRIVWENGNICLFHKDQSHQFSFVDPDSLVY